MGDTGGVRADGAGGALMRKLLLNAYIAVMAFLGPLIAAFAILEVFLLPYNLYDAWRDGVLEEDNVPWVVLAWLAACSMTWPMLKGFFKKSVSRFDGFESDGRD